MRMTDRDRRDWSLLIFIVPIGILLMMIAGGFAMWATPQWSVQAGMGSSLEIGAGNSQNGPRPLINPQILTPFSWLGTYLTPSGDNTLILPFVVIQPSATPSATVVPVITESPPTQVTVSQTVTVVTTPPANTFTPTATSKPPDDDTPEEPPATPSATATPTGIISTMPAEYTQHDPPPADIGVGTLPDNTNPSNDSNIGAVSDGTYVVINLSVVVEPTPDDNYDLAFYEFNNGGVVYLDWIIIGISNYSDGSQYYEVFNWGNGIADDNSNVGDVAGTEGDNQPVQLSELHDPDYSTGPPVTNGPAPQTGILIDVDNATSDPPAATYDYIVIISPNGGSGDSAQVDAVQVTEVPIPTPPAPP